MRDNGEELEESENLLLLSKDGVPDEEKVDDDNVEQEQENENASDNKNEGVTDLNQEQKVDDEDAEKDDNNSSASDEAEDPDYNEKTQFSL